MTAARTAHEHTIPPHIVGVFETFLASIKSGEHTVASAWNEALHNFLDTYEPDEDEQP